MKTGTVVKRRSSHARDRLDVYDEGRHLGSIVREAMHGGVRIVGGELDGEWRACPGAGVISVCRMGGVRPPLREKVSRGATPEPKNIYMDGGLRNVGFLHGGQAADDPAGMWS
jgi:hypothetical protein